MYCQRCGKEMKEGASFCPNCGWGHSQKKKGNLLLYILPIIVIIIGLFIFINSQKKDNYYANNDVISKGFSQKNETSQKIVILPELLKKYQEIKSKTSKKLTDSSLFYPLVGPPVMLYNSAENYTYDCKFDDKGNLFEYESISGYERHYNQPIGANISLIVYYNNGIVDKYYQRSSLMDGNTYKNGKEDLEAWNEWQELIDKYNSMKDMYATLTTISGEYVSADGGNSNNNQIVTRDATSEKIANIKLANSYGLDTSIESMDTVSMGSYFKNDSDENNKKPIEWIVLDRQGNKALLLSKYIIDNKCYHEQYEDVTWETCTLRNWLNNEFYNKAFSNSEKEKIQTTSVVNNNNIDTNINGGNSTNDKIFLLSIEEIMQYFGNGEKMKNGYQLGTNVSTSGTRYAKDVVNNGRRLWVFDYENNTDADKSERRWADGNSSFWLRSPGNYPKAAALVDYASYLDTKGYGGDNKLTGVRPAMWVTY